EPERRRRGSRRADLRGGSEEAAGGGRPPPAGIGRGAKRSARGAGGAREEGEGRPPGARGGRAVVRRWVELAPPRLARRKSAGSREGGLRGRSRGGAGPARPPRALSLRRPGRNPSRAAGAGIRGRAAEPARPQE